MTSALDGIIEGAADPSVRTADLLRRAAAAAHRLEATEIREWARRELSGYPEETQDDDLPVYRRSIPTGASTYWTGYGGTSETRTLTAPDQPDDWFAVWFRVAFRQPVSELESLMSAEDGGLGIPWPGMVITRWNELAAQGKAFGLSGMTLYRARTLVPKQALVGVVDAIRTEVMSLAMDLQSANTEAGAAGGPTVADDAEVRQVATQFITNIYGDGATIAQGHAVSQQVTVHVGDVVTLTQAAQTTLDADGLADYVDAVLAARTDPEKSKLRAFLEKVRGGAYALVGGVASNVAADQLMQWATQFLGG
ncbi:hypothetical protein ACQFYA_20840 [Promicromonospora sp. Marseille-Q5078]